MGAEHQYDEAEKQLTIDKDLARRAKGDFESAYAKHKLELRAIHEADGKKVSEAMLETEAMAHRSDPLYDIFHLYNAMLERVAARDASVVRVEQLKRKYWDAKPLR